MAGKLPGRALASTANLTLQTISVGNSTINTVINSTSVSVAGGATFGGHLMPSANITYDIGNTTMRWRDLWLSGSTINLGGAIIKTDTDTGAIAFVPKSTAEVPNPKAVVVSPQGGIVAVSTTDGVPIINNSITTVDGISYGNSTVNTSVNSTSVSTITLNVGSNVFVNTSTIHLGNSTVNTVIHTTGFTGNGAGLHNVNAAALEGNTVANILTAANTAANTLANAAYSNAVSYAASNTYVNNTFLPLAGGTLTGAITVGNSTVNSVVNSTSASLGNTTINGFVNVSSNLTVTSVAAFGNNVTITGNLIVTGTRIFANTTTVDLSDNIITLNADIGQVTPSENAGLEVHRGTSANVQFVWNETIDKWTFTTDGTNYVTVASNNDVTTSYSNAIAYSGNAALAYANAIAYAASNSYVNSTFAPLSGAAFTGAVSGITTLAAGNTTITGLINVSTNTSTFGTALYVVANGNVGIGTISPGAKLHALVVPATNATVDDVLKLTSKFPSVNNAASAAVGSGPAIVFSGGIGDNQTRDRARIVAVYEDSNVSGLAFHTQDTADIITEKVRFRNNGNVGIGNTAPTSRLHVSGPTSSSLPVIDITATGTGTYMRGVRVLNSGMASGNHIMYACGYADNARNMGQFYFYFDSSGSTSNRLSMGLHSVDDVFNITGAGNVGIGTTTPATKLHVAGTGTFTGQLNTADIISLGFNVNGTVATTARRGIELHSDGSNDYWIGKRAGAWTQPLDIAFYTGVRYHAHQSHNGHRFFVGGWDSIEAFSVGNGDNHVRVLYNLSVGGTITESSSIALKQNIDPITNALDLVSKLVGVTYDRKDGSAMQRAGLIAEEVEQVLPNVVQKDHHGNPSGIQYTNLIAYLVESIKELKAEIDALKSK